MSLSDKLIFEEIENGNIILNPLNKEMFNPNSVDLTLANKIKVAVPDLVDDPMHFIKKIQNDYSDVMHLPLISIPTEVFDCKKDNTFKELDIPDDGFLLIPGMLYLACCNERIGVKGNIKADVMGKSSLGRLGLFVHITAGFIDTGFEGSLVLEMVATVPLMIYKDMRVCQIEFTRVEGDILQTYDLKKNSKYHNQTGIQESKMEENFRV